MAHYMMRRAGIDDAQVEKIEGYASSRLRNQKDPLAAENRRIEFLLRVSDP
jgi:chemotaxis protein MotB